MGIYADKLLIEQKQQENFMQVLNEVYFGRTPSINSLFNIYCDWREPFISKTKHFTATTKNFYNNNEYKIFQESVCKQFGFETFSYLVKQEPMINSFTYGTLLPIKNSPMFLEINKNGYRFKKEAKVNSIIRVYSDLIFNPEYTNEENFAVFLHEVGHNFQAAANNTMYSLEAATAIFKILQIFMEWGPLETGISLVTSSNWFKGIENRITNYITYNEFLSSILTVTSACIYILKKGLNMVNILSNIIMYPINICLGVLYRIPKFIIGLTTGIHQSGYYGERFADGFAASYGFGEALASCLNKFENISVGDNTIDAIINEVPVLGHIVKLTFLPGMLLHGLIDVHPTTESRCASIIKDLKTDLNDPQLPPHLKKQLSKEIEDYEKAMHEYYTTAKNIKNPGFVSAYIQEWLYNSGGGLKLKISELPYKQLGGFRAETNRTRDWINQGKYDISNTIIK